MNLDFGKLRSVSATIFFHYQEEYIDRGICFMHTTQLAFLSTDYKPRYTYIL